MTGTGVALDLTALLPGDWRATLEPLLDPAATAALGAFVGTEYATHAVFPPVEDLFAAYRWCPPQECRVLILGQDPYHGPGQAHGLSFSVRPGVRVPPSLRNVLAELAEDVGVPPTGDGDLSGWASQGVLLLNAVLTVRSGAAASHAGKGWEAFTDATIRALNARDERIVFLLWGGYARKKAVLVTNPAHVVLEAGHPSPLNRSGFRGARPFSAADEALAAAGRPVIDWGRRHPRPAGSMTARLRRFRWRDITEVMAIEEDLFGAETWSPAMFWNELANRHHYLVAVDGDVVLGYAGLAVTGPDESWVQNIAVRRSAQRLGIGRALLEGLLAEASRRGPLKVLLEVAVDNVAAQRLYAGYDFEPVGVRRGYYQPSNTDALVMMRNA